LRAFEAEISASRHWRQKWFDPYELASDRIGDRGGKSVSAAATRLLEKRPRWEPPVAPVASI
jgi:hypothetical protein